MQSLFWGLLPRQALEQSGTGRDQAASCRVGVGRLQAGKAQMTLAMGHSQSLLPIGKATLGCCGSSTLPQLSWGIHPTEVCGGGWVGEGIQAGQGRFGGGPGLEKQPPISQAWGGEGQRRGRRSLEKREKDIEKQTRREGRSWGHRYWERVETQRQEKRQQRQSQRCTA